MKGAVSRVRRESEKHYSSSEGEEKVEEKMQSPADAI